MKKISLILGLSLIVVGGFVFANRNKTTENPKNTIAKPLSDADKNKALKKWEASPDGIMVQKWKASPEGTKVLAAAAKISTSIKNFSEMEAVVTDLSLPKGSNLGFGIMVNSSGEDYILAFGPEISMNKNNEFKALKNLKVNDKITIKSHHVSYAPKYAYPIIAGDFIAHNQKEIYKRTLKKGKC